MFKLKSKQQFMAIFFFILLLLTFGCSGQENPPQEQFEEIPSQLEDIETSIEQIFYLLDGPSKLEDIKAEEDQEKSKEEESEPEESKQEEGQKQDQNTEQGKEAKQGDSEQQSETGDKQEQPKDESPKQKDDQQLKKPDPWEQIAQEIKKLHTQWNDYMPELAKKNSDKKMIDDFSNALNNLTQTIDKKDRMNTLTAANNLYANIPTLYAQYKTKISPEVKRMIYYTRSSVLDSMDKQWTKAESDMESLKSSWEMLKNSLDKEQEDDSNKINLSVYELEKVVEEHNPDLIDLKGRITLSNVKEMEEKLKARN